MSQPDYRQPPDNRPPPAKKSSLLLFLIIFIGGGVLACGCVGLVLVGLFIPGLQTMKEREQRAKTLSEMSQLAHATHIYINDFNRLPPGKGKVGQKDGTVLYFLLPYVEQINLFNMGPAAAANVPVRIYCAPVDTTIGKDGLTKIGTGAASYGGNLNIFPITDKPGGGLKFPKAFAPAGAPSVVMFATVAGNCSDGTHGHSDLVSPPLLSNGDPSFNGPPFRRQTAAGLSGGAVIVAMGDASVRTVSASVSSMTWKIVLDPQSTVPPPPDWID